MCRRKMHMKIASQGCPSNRRSVDVRKIFQYQCRHSPIFYKRSSPSRWKVHCKYIVRYFNGSYHGNRTRLGFVCALWNPASQFSRSKTTTLDLPDISFMLPTLYNSLYIAYDSLCLEMRLGRPNRISLCMTNVSLSLMKMFCFAIRL